MEYVGVYENVDTELIYYIYKDANKLIAATASNASLVIEHEFKIDDCFSFDENLQAFVEEIEERERKESENSKDEQEQEQEQARYDNEIIEGEKLCIMCSDKHDDKHALCKLCTEEDDCSKA